MINSHINNHWVCPRARCRAHFYCSSFVHQMLRVNMYLLHAMSVRLVSCPCTYQWPHDELTALTQNSSPSPTPYGPRPAFLFGPTAIWSLQDSLRVYKHTWYCQSDFFFLKVNLSLSFKASTTALKPFSGSSLMTCEDRLPQPGYTSDASLHTHPCVFCHWGLLAFSTSGPLHVSLVWKSSFPLRLIQLIQTLAQL